MNKFVHLAFNQSTYGDTGPLRYDLGDIFGLDMAQEAKPAARKAPAKKAPAKKASAKKAAPRKAPAKKTEVKKAARRSGR